MCTLVHLTLVRFIRNELILPLVKLISSLLDQMDKLEFMSNIRNMGTFFHLSLVLNFCHVVNISLTS